MKLFPLIIAVLTIGGAALLNGPDEMNAVESCSHSPIQCQKF